MGTGSIFTENQRPDITAINRLLRELCSGNRCERGQQVHRGTDFVLDPAGRNVTGPAHEAGHPHRAFARVVSEAPVGSAPSLEGTPLHGPVIAGPDDQRVVRDSEAFQRCHDFARAPVEFFDAVAVIAIAGTTAKLWTRKWVSG